MIPDSPTVSVPLRADKRGAIRVSGTDLVGESSPHPKSRAMNGDPDRRFAARRGTSKAVFSPSPSVSVREKGPGDEGQNALKSIDQQHQSHWIPWLGSITRGMLHESFDVVPLNDVYAVIAYYLAHREELDAYIQQGKKEEAERLRQEMEAKYPPVTRAELEKRLAARKNKQEN